MTLPLVLVSSALADYAVTHPCDTSHPISLTKACACATKGPLHWYDGMPNKDIAAVDLTTYAPYVGYGIDGSCFDYGPFVEAILESEWRTAIGEEIDAKAFDVADYFDDRWLLLDEDGTFGLMSGEDPNQYFWLQPAPNNRYKVMNGNVVVAVVVIGTAGVPYEAISVDWDGDSDDDVVVGFANRRWILHGPLQGQTFYPPSP